jgi:hypothetical protein
MMRNMLELLFKQRLSTHLVCMLCENWQRRVLCNVAVHFKRHMLRAKMLPKWKRGIVDRNIEMSTSYVESIRKASAPAVGTLIG